MTPADLKRIANTPGYGTGAAARRRLAAEAEVKAALPPPGDVQPVWAATDSDHIPMAHFGNSGDDGQDWALYWEDRSAQTDAFGHDARDDARIVAAIVNAYRLGVLVRSD